MKINLSHHLAIGFHREWLEMQGLSGQNLLKILVDECIRTKTDILGLTSEESKPIERNSVDDRLGFLITRHASELPGHYQVDQVDENLVCVQQSVSNRAVHIINTQTVQPKASLENVKFLVVGGNDITNNAPLTESLQEARDKRYLIIAENPCGNGKDSIETKAIERNKEYFDAIVGHDAQFRIPAIFYYLGKTRAMGLHAYTKKINAFSQEFADDLKSPWIAIGNQHSPGRLKAGIEIPDGSIDLQSTGQVVRDLREVIKARDYKPIRKYENPVNWAKWTLAFRRGTKDDRHLNYTE